MVLVRGQNPADVVKENPYDFVAWDVFIHALKEMPCDQARPHFEQLVKTFPSCGYYWKVYIEYEASNGNNTQVENLFQRCLRKVLNIELWKCYVIYCRNNLSRKGLYNQIQEVYEFAVDNVGLDHHAYVFYKLYIDFLDSSATEICLGSAEIRVLIRQVYHRALQTPMANYKQLWKDYCCFEQKSDSRKAAEHIGTMMPVYSHVQKVAQEMDSLVCNLNRKHVAVPCTNSVAESEQITLWREYIAWEKSNPLQTSDYCYYVRRVMYAYEQVLLCFVYHLEFWCESVDFLENAAETAYQMKMEEASNQYCKEIRGIFDRAIKSSMSKTLLLYSMYAEFEEGQKQLSKVHSIYKSFISIREVDPSLAYIQYMKFARRAEGFKSVRAVFKAAREDPRTKSEVYTVAAHLEYFGNQDATVAVKIFELGLKKFPGDGDFALSYTNFLLRFNEDASARVLFERILSSGSLPLEKAAVLWDEYIDFEARLGGLVGIAKVSERRQEALSKKFGEMPTALLIDRYRFLDLMPAPDSDLRMLGYPELISLSRSYEMNAKETDKGANTSDIPQPDLVSLIPFKPRKVCKSFFHPVPGGDFPPPPSVARIMSSVPPPRCFNSPFVKVDELLELLRNAEISGYSNAPEGQDKTGGKADKAEPAKAGKETNGKRAALAMSAEATAEADEEQVMVYTPPAHDIYLSRRLKRT